MYKIAVLLVILICCVHTIECGIHGRSSGRTSGISSSSFVGKRNSYLVGAAADNSISTSDRSNLPRDLSKQGLSAWGLILIIVAVIVLAFSAYYGIICYPILCKTEKNYQFMDASSTMTAATSRSIQSMENFQIDPTREQKH